MLINKYLSVLAIFLILFTVQAFGHGMSESEKQIIADGGNLKYIWIGATHMLSGYDHLAFVFGMVFFLTRFNEIIKYITAFTLGHSITLIIATFNVIKINYFLIDAVIALSICYIAFYNLDGFKKYSKFISSNMLFVIFSLGLVHGLGLSTRLQELPLDYNNLLMNIISFNVGIEIGQIIALTIMLFVLFLIRKIRNFSYFSKIVNLFLFIMGIFLFTMQINDYKDNLNWKDTILVIVPANGEIEYKVMIPHNEIVEYEWKLNKGVLFYDLHGEPKNDTTGYFQSFKEGISDKMSGSILTNFEGTHGWYFKNDNSFPIEVTLKMKGNYNKLLRKIKNF